MWTKTMEAFFCSIESYTISDWTQVQYMILRVNNVLVTESWHHFVAVDWDVCDSDYLPMVATECFLVTVLPNAPAISSPCSISGYQNHVLPSALLVLIRRKTPYPQ